MSGGYYFYLLTSTHSLEGADTEPALPSMRLALEIETVSTFRAHGPPGLRYALEALQVLLMSRSVFCSTVRCSSI